jgi:hypothetical protein
MKKTALKAIGLLGLATLSAGYFGTFSQLDLPFNAENYLMLVPVQVGVLAYLFLFRKPTPNPPTTDQAEIAAARDDQPSINDRRP